MNSSPISIPHPNLFGYSCKALWCSIIFFILSSFTTGYTLVSSYRTNAGSIAIDNFGNFYAAAPNSVLKFSNDGSFLYRYEEFKYGKIGMIDVNNPLKTLVFYPDFMTVVMVDRFLAPINTYNFFELGYQNVSAVASSTDGRIWFYDNIEFKLKKIDESGKIFRESQPLNMLMSQTLNPNFMMERDNKVFLNDPNIGILVFDIFGSYEKTIPLKGVSKFQILQDQLVYFDHLQLNAYSSFTLEVKTLHLPDTTGVVSAAIGKDRLGILKNDRIDFYRY